MGTSDPLRVAVVGYGLAGSVFHAPLIAAVPGLQVAAVVTGSAERAAAARARYPGVTVLSDADTLFADPSAVDLVVVAAPNAAHVPLARRAVAAGLPVVVDKSLAATAAEAAALVAEARAAGVLLVPYHNRRWDGDFLTLRGLVENGTLGRLVRFESRFERYRPQVQHERWRESGDPAAGGGLLLDLGPHLVDQALVLFGAPTAVYAEVGRARFGAAVDDDVFVALTYADGPRVHLWASMAAPVPAPRFRVNGLDGGFEVFGLDPQEAALRDGGVPGDPGWGVDDRTGTLTGDADTAVPLQPGAYERFYEGVRDAVVDGAAPPVDAADAVLGLRVLEAARRSADTGTVVPFEEAP